MSLSAIIVAAGKSTRFGADKLWADLAGRPLLRHTIENVAWAECVDDIFVVTSEAEVARVEGLSRGIQKLRGVIVGGERRQDSVCAGLAKVDAEFVAIHDGARALIGPEEIERVFAAARETGAAALAAEVSETLKRADRDRRVAESIDRNDLFAMQTPQIFRTELLRRAYDKVGAKTVTDEVSVMQGIGERTQLVIAKEPNLKITFASDLALAASIIAQRRKL